MSNDFVLSQLNEQQLEIVCRPKDEDILVIAGAGTGKTRVLISRICSLIETEGVSPNSILAVTFTNKAALEMKERLIKAMHWEEKDMHMWVTTFHSLCARLLHMFAAQALLPPNFTVLGAKDQQHLIKDFLGKNDFSKQCLLLTGSRPKDIGRDVSDIVKYIGSRKEKGLRCQISTETLLEYMSDIPALLKTEHDTFMELMYGIYNIICERAGAVDFNELILRCLWLLKTNDEVRTRLNNRFQYILIDEFQDTDKSQYQLMKLLRGDTGRVFVVGDDDQAIYGWRGADYENLHRLEVEIPDINIMPLSINYRSTQNILNFANSLIFHDENRIIKKRLFTMETYHQQRKLYPKKAPLELAEILPQKVYDPDSPRVIVCRIDYEPFEGEYVTSLIKTLHTKFKVPLSEIAVLYRKNSLSSSIERALNSENIPYQIYGGLKFYEREEILDAMAYLRLISNSNDDVALSRVYNVPRRKLGPTSWSYLSSFANSCGCSVYEALQRLPEIETPPQKIKSIAKNFGEFFALIESLRKEVNKRALPNFIDYVLQKTGLLTHYAQVDLEKGNTSSGTSKVENLKQLLVNADYFMQYASLQDVDIEKQDIDEVFPLPNGGVKFSRSSSSKSFYTVIEDDDDTIDDFELYDDDELQSEELLSSEERSQQRKVEFSAYVNKVQEGELPDGAADGAISDGTGDVGDKKLSLAAERSVRRTLDEQAMGALASQGFTTMDLINSFIRSAALTASAESNVVGQIPLAGLEQLDQELSTHLQEEGLKQLELDLEERSKTDLDALKQLDELRAGRKKQSGTVDSVQLMTIHAAKGLEFEAVIVIGCEETTLPSFFALNSGRKQQEALAEERRLAYVAFTRAKRYLVATFNQEREARYGNNFGRFQMKPSRFLTEAEAETKRKAKTPFVNTPLNSAVTSKIMMKYFTTETQELQEKEAEVKAQALEQAAARRNAKQQKVDEDQNAEELNALKRRPSRPRKR